MLSVWKKSVFVQYYSVMFLQLKSSADVYVLHGDKWNYGEVDLCYYESSLITAAVLFLRNFKKNTDERRELLRKFVTIGIKHMEHSSNNIYNVM